MENNLFDEVIETFGEEHQINMIEEELLELATAIKKYKRKKYGPEAVDAEGLIKYEKNIIEEAADVLVVMNYIPRILKKNTELRDRVMSEMNTVQAEKISRLERTVKNFKKKPGE